MRVNTRPNLRKGGSCEAAANLSVELSKKGILSGTRKGTLQTQKGHVWFELSSGKVIDPSLKDNLRSMGVSPEIYNRIPDNKYLFGAKEHQEFISHIPESNGTNTSITNVDPFYRED